MPEARAAKTLRLEQALREAVALHTQGAIADAERLYQEILSADGKHFDALHLLGVVRTQQGRCEEAVRLIGKALKRNPGHATAHLNLGNALAACDRDEDAIVSFRRASALAPQDARAQGNLANVFWKLNRYEEAVASYRAAVALAPGRAAAHDNLGAALQALKRHEEAIASHQAALALDPGYAEAHFNLGSALQALERNEEAIDSYRKALAIRPDHIEALYNLADALRQQDELGAALECCRKALSIKPDFVAARWALTTYQISAVSETSDSIAEVRAACARELAGLGAWLDSARIEQGILGPLNWQPFFLAYQEECNRDLLSQYGDLWVRLTRQWQPAQARASRRISAGDRIRVGVVSAHIRNHPVWNAIIKGWVQHLDRGRFELELYHLDSTQDEETACAKSRASYFDFSGTGVRDAVQGIVGRRPDVLIYPEIGMHPLATTLAALRLAPVQAASWGHPETSGLPTVDYFLSAADLEPPGAQQNYRETLVELPHLGCCYQALAGDVVEPDLASLGISPDRPLLVCPGTPFKYAPQHDWVFPDIARRLGRCQFIFFVPAARRLADKMRQRLELAFARAHLDLKEHVVFIPWQPKPQFYGLLRRADVFLDTIGFSGFNTAMQAVECGLPIVTREGRFMRGRLASGILKRMGLMELVAGSEQEYVELAVRLAEDAGYRQQIRARIEAGRGVLFDDVAPIRALEDFLAGVVAT